MSDDKPQACFHCGEPVPPGVHILARVTPPQPVCCQGCAAVAELISGAGLVDYYRYRQQPGNKPDHNATDRWQGYAQPDIADAFVSTKSINTDNAESSVTLLLGGLRCAACVWLIERHLRDVPGVLSAQVNAGTERALIRWRTGELTLADVLRRVAELGYQPQPLDRLRHIDSCQQAQHEQRTLLKRVGVAALGMMQVMMYVLPLYDRQHSGMGEDIAQALSFISLLITTPVLWYSGWPFLRSAMLAIRHRHINMDVPVSLALLLAYAASVWNLFWSNGETYFDSITMFIFLLTLGRYIEMRVRHRSGNVTDALSRMQPDLAHRRDGDGSTEQWRDVALTQLQSGDELLVRAGETIPADGDLLSGQCMVNEALLTGESLPVAKLTGDTLLAGAINLNTPLRMRVTALGEATLLSGMVRMMEQAQFDKPRIALQADRVARIFLHAMLWVSLMVGVAWYFVDPSRAFDAVLAVLVVTCPCALSLATPTVIAACISSLARHGLLVTRADAVERLAQVDSVWFDKTGTLTQGDLALQSLQCSEAMNRSEALSVAAALEAGAHHPIADAIRRHANELNAPYVVASELQVVPGQGVQGLIAGVLYRLGTRRFVAELASHTGDTTAFDTATTNTDIGADDAIVLGNAQGERAAMRFSDSLRADASRCITELTHENMRVALYSGDADAPVAEVARQLNMADWHARQRPCDKLRALKASQRHIAMVGDGVNDAPVLAAAHVSIAMGRGAALAQASADMLLMNSTLTSLPVAFALARKARRIMQQNLWWALVYNMGAVPLAAFGWVTPWVAALGMSLSSVLVTLNAARVMRMPVNIHSHADVKQRVVQPSADTLQVGLS